MNWKRTVRRLLIAIVVLLVAMVTGASLLLRSRSFHRYLLAKMVQKAEQATGSRVKIRDFTFRWSGLRADLYGITLEGAGPNPTKPLLVLDHLGVGLKIISTLGHKFRLSYIVLDHPVVHLTVNRQGRTNIPTPHNPAGFRKPINIFNIAAGAVQLNRGEVYYQNARLPLDASCRNLQMQLVFNSLRTAFDGAISYKEGTIHFGKFSPLHHYLEARFNAAPSGLTVTQLVVASGSSRISAQAQLADYSNPSVSGTYRMIVSNRQLQEMFKNRSVPIGQVTTSGSLHYQRMHGQPFLRGLTIDGQLHSSRLDLNIPQVHSAFHVVRSRYRLANGNLMVQGVEADALGGHVTADMTIQHLGSTPSSHVTGSFRGVSLSAVNAALSFKPLKDVPLEGRADGTLTATWPRQIRRVKIHSDITITGDSLPLKTRRAQTSATMKIPVSGVLHCNYDVSQNALSLSQSYLKTPHLNVQVNGTLGAQSQMSVNASADSLHEVDVLVHGIRRNTAHQASSAPAQLLGLEGAGSFAGQILGSVKDPTFTGQVMARNVQFHNEHVLLARSQITLGRSQLKLAQGNVAAFGGGAIRFDATVGLNDWRYSPVSPMTIQAAVNRIQLADLERLTSLHFPATGLVHAAVSVQGSQTNPSGAGSVRITNARLYNQPVQNVSVQFHAINNTINSTLRIVAPAGVATGNFNFVPRTKSYAGHFEASNIRLGQLQAVRSRALGLSGSLSVTAKGSGTFQSPQLNVSVQIPMLEYGQQRIGAIKAQFQVANQHVNVLLQSAQGNMSLKADGNVDLEHDYYATAKFDAQGAPPSSLLARYLPGDTGNLHVETEIHGSLQGPLKYPERLAGHVEIPTLKMGYRSIELANVGDMRADYRNATLTLQPAEIKGTETDLRLHGTTPLRGPGSMNISAQGTVNLRVIQLLYPEWDSAGQLVINLHARGSRSNPDFGGDMRIVNAAFQAPGAPVGIEKLNAQFALENNRIEIRQFAGVMGGGDVSAQGSVTYSPSVGFNVTMDGKRVRLRYPQGVRTVLDSHLAWVGTTEDSTLSGQVLIDRMSFTQTFDFGTFINQFNSEAETPPSQGLTQNIKLKVEIQSAEQLGLVSNTLSLQGSANLRVRGTVAEPIILGRATATGGQVSFLHRTYQIQSGSINFVNPVRTEPVVSVLVTTVVNQYNLSLNLNGPINHLRTTYTSDPPLPPVDIINLLVRGETTEEAAAQPSAPGMMGAESVLAQGLAGQVSGQITKFTGISSLTIDPLIGGDQQNPGARLAIQKNVTKNLSFTFSTDVTTTQGQIIQVQYQLTPRWSVSIVRDQYGAVGVDVRMHKSF